MNKIKKRDSMYDILRIIAIIMVLYNHRYTYIYPNNYDIITLKYIIGATLSIICKCGPPLFFMISGALLLKKEESFKYILKHRVSRILIIMVICSFLIMIRDNRLNFILVFTQKLNWYLYYYLAYLLMLPFLRKIALYSNEKEMNLYMILVCIFYTFSQILTYFNYSIYFIDNLAFYNSNWGSVCWYFIFPMSGYFLTQLLKNNNIKKYFNIFGIVSLISLIIAIILCSLDIKMHNGVNLENLRAHAIYPISCFIFISIYYIKYKIKNIKTTKILTFLSNATFGIFILETHTNISNLICNTLNSHLNNYLGLYCISVLSIIIEFILYTTIISILRLIPCVKKII